MSMSEREMADLSFGCMVLSGIFALGVALINYSYVHDGLLALGVFCLSGVLMFLFLGLIATVFEGDNG